MLLTACGGGGGPTEADGSVAFAYPEAWPSDLAAVFTTTYVDGTGDQVALPPEMAGPPYSGPVPFPPVDVERVLLGIEGDFLFLRVDFAGAIPTAVVHIAESGETEDNTWIIL